MMKMNRKKWLCGVAACLCLTGSTVPVFADTVTFNITIPGDIISKRSVKADDEQKFYVTGTKFSGSGKLYCKSSRLHATTTSNTATISKKYSKCKCFLYELRAAQIRIFYALYSKCRQFTCRRTLYTVICK